MEGSLDDLMHKLTKEKVEDFDLIKEDDYLRPHLDFFRARASRLDQIWAEIKATAGSLENFALGFRDFGLHWDDKTVSVREWLPGAKRVLLCGDFNAWGENLELSRDEFGVWKGAWPAETVGLKQGQRFKLRIQDSNNNWLWRLSAWTRRAVPETPGGVYIAEVDGVDSKPFEFQHPRPKLNGPLKIYECHIGMSSEAEETASFSYFREHVLPRVVESGYNCLQIMAIAEHVYYGSFGYHVTSFFAVSSRFGGADEFRKLIDAAHEKGVAVLLDVVHAHASANVEDGLGDLDGTGGNFFHAGPRGVHSLWGSRLFDFGKTEVLRFLLSNLRFWLDEFKVDGFRFDGVTSIIFNHHGIDRGFDRGYPDFFEGQVDLDGMIFLLLANILIKKVAPEAISIAEDVSGFPGIAASPAYGGVGFDFRLNMALPDLWIRLLKEVPDEEWPLGHIVHVLKNVRRGEKVVAYAESHDQALVGDKTLSMRLIDAQVYTHMSVLNSMTPEVFRGRALHKALRFLSLVFGDAYLNFMGNEFGHPEWIDFPREGNGWSYKHCRRQWSLADREDSRYRLLLNWDKARMGLEDKFQIMAHHNSMHISVHEQDKVILLEGKNILLAFCLHPTQSFPDYRVGLLTKRPLRVIEHSDRVCFGGAERLAEPQPTDKLIAPESIPQDGKPFSFMTYLPNRTVIAFNLIDE